MFRQCPLTFGFLEGGGKEASVLGVVQRNLAVTLEAELDHVVEQANDRGCRPRAVDNGVVALARVVGWENSAGESGVQVQAEAVLNRALHDSQECQRVAEHGR